MRLDRFFVFLCVLVLMTATGCSGGGSDSGGNANPSNPADKEQALAKLSPIHKQNFENWKLRLIKACDASEAFGAREGREQAIETQGVDGAVLLERNHASVVFVEGNQFALVNSPRSFSGVGHSKVEVTEDQNGQITSLSAEAKRNGSACEIFLFGQKVHEVYIAESFQVATQWVPDKKAQVESVVPQIRALGASGKSEVTQHGVFNLISQILMPSKESLSLISKKLTLNDEQAAKYFLISNSVWNHSAVRIQNIEGSVWSNEESGNLIASTSVLQKLFVDLSRPFTVNVRLGIPKFKFIASENTADRGSFEFSFALQMTRKVSNTPNTIVSSSEKVEIAGFRAFDQKEALSCVRDRAIPAFRPEQTRMEISPAVRTLLSPCQTFDPEIEKLSYESGLFKSLIPQMLTGVIPSQQFQYRGWDQVLSRLALEALEKDQDIKHELDPLGVTQVVGVMASHLTTLRQEVGRSQNLNVLKDTILQMGLNWALQGAQVSSLQIARLLQAADHSVVPYRVSTDRLLRSFGQEPQRQEEAIQFALALSPEYKAESVKALGLSKELSYEGFESEVFNQILQTRPDLAKLQEWSSKLGTVATEVKKYPSMGAVRGEVVGHSIRWLTSGEVVQSDLGSIYSAIQNSVEPFAASTKTLVQALSKPVVENKESLDYARLLTAESKQLALAIVQNSKALEFESWGKSFFDSILQKRPTLEQLRAWNEMWSQGLAFTQREKERMHGEFGASNEWARKEIIETAIRETWGQQEFVGLETIAELARSKNTCSNDKGMSSLAKCAGLSGFTKNKGYFDPAFGGRYAGLGREFVQYMQQLQSSDWTSLRWEFVGKFFGYSEPVWSKCDQNSFTQKAGVLNAQVNGLVREGDTFKKWELVRQIKETLKNCP